MTQTTFDLVFDGTATRGGEIDVTELAPALLALGQAVKAAGRIVVGPDAEISLKVRAHEEGSFRVLLTAIANGELGLAWTMIRDFYQSDDGQAAKAVIETLVGAGTILGVAAAGVIAVIKKLRGRKIEKEERVGPNEVKITFDGVEMIIPVTVLQVLRDQPTRSALEKLIADPLSKDGIDEVRLSTPNGSVSVDKSEGEFFRATAGSESELTSNYRKAFSIISLSFKRGNKWRLHDGQSARSITVLDQEFMDMIDRSEVAFSKGDILICEVREVALRTADGIRSNLELVKVLEHRPRAVPPTLPL
jgi:hypothetical protein